MTALGVPTLLSDARSCWTSTVTAASVRMDWAASCPAAAAGAPGNDATLLAVTSASACPLVHPASASAIANDAIYVFIVVLLRFRPRRGEPRTGRQKWVTKPILPEGASQPLYEGLPIPALAAWP